MHVPHSAQEFEAFDELNISEQDDLTEIWKLLDSHEKRTAIEAAWKSVDRLQLIERVAIHRGQREKSPEKLALRAFLAAIRP